MRDRQVYALSNYISTIWDWCHNLTKNIPAYPVESKLLRLHFYPYPDTCIHEYTTILLLCSSNADTKFCARTWSKNPLHRRKPQRKFSNKRAWIRNLSGLERPRWYKHEHTTTDWPLLYFAWIYNCLESFLYMLFCVSIIIFIVNIPWITNLIYVSILPSVIFF